MGSFDSGGKFFLGGTFLFSLCVFRIILSAWESQGIPIFEVEGGEFEGILIFPVAQTDEIGELLVGEEDIEHTFEDDIFFAQGFILFLYFFSFSLVLVFKLENFF